jgi:quercetin dioxygenase-like cupin family protein
MSIKPVLQALAGAMLLANPLTASAVPEEAVTPVFSAALSNAAGKSLSALRVDFPPGAKALGHRHGDAFVYAYVLSGEVRSQLAGQPAKVYRAGESWSEPPGAHHTLTENVSATEPASLLAVFFADTGAVLKINDAH